MITSLPAHETNVGQWSEDKLKMEDYPSDTVTKAEVDEKGLVTTFRRVMDVDNEKKLFTEEIDIGPQELQRLVLKHQRDRPPRDEDYSAPLQLSSPFANFVWYWEDYVKECEPQPEDEDRTKEAREDLKVLLGLIKKSSLEPYFKIRDSLSASKTIKFDYLWTLFPRGTLVYSRTFMTDFQMLEVESYSDDSRSFTLKCSGFDWDGLRFEAYTYTLEITKFDGEKAIDSLAVFPVANYRDANGDHDDSQLRKRLIERGRKFLKLCTAQPQDFQCSYKGICMAETTGLARLTAGREELAEDNASYGGASSGGGDDANQITTKTVDVSGKVIVDHLTFMRSDRNLVRFDLPPLSKLDPYRTLYLDCECNVCQKSIVQLWNVEKQQSTKPLHVAFGENEMRLMLCPPQSPWVRTEGETLGSVPCRGCYTTYRQG